MIYQSQSTQAGSALQQRESNTPSVDMGSTNQALRSARQAAAQTVGDLTRGDTTVVTSRVKQQIAQRPWAAVGLSVAVGYALGSLAGGANTAEDWRAGPAFRTYSGESHGSGTMRYTPTQSDHPASIAAQNDGGARSSATSDRAQPPHAAGPGLLGQLMGQFDDPLSALMDTAATTVLGLFHDTIEQNVPGLHQQIERVRRERALPSAASAYEVADRSQAARAFGAPESSRFDM